MYLGGKTELRKRQHQKGRKVGLTNNFTREGMCMRISLPLPLTLGLEFYGVPLLYLTDFVSIGRSEQESLYTPKKPI